MQHSLPRGLPSPGIIRGRLWNTSPTSRHYGTEKLQGHSQSCPHYAEREARVVFARLDSGQKKKKKLSGHKLVFTSNKNLIKAFIWPSRDASSCFCLFVVIFFLFLFFVYQIVFCFFVFFSFFVCLSSCFCLFVFFLCINLFLFVRCFFSIKLFLSVRCFFVYQVAFVCSFFLNFFFVCSLLFSASFFLFFFVYHVVFCLLVVFCFFFFCFPFFFFLSSHLFLLFTHGETRIRLAPNQPKSDCIFTIFELI